MFFIRLQPNAIEKVSIGAAQIRNVPASRFQKQPETFGAARKPAAGDRHVRLGGSRFPPDGEGHAGQKTNGALIRRHHQAVAQQRVFEFVLKGYQLGFQLGPGGFGADRPMHMFQRAQEVVAQQQGGNPRRDVLAGFGRRGDCIGREYDRRVIVFLRGRGQDLGQQPVDRGQPGLGIAIASMRRIPLLEECPDVGCGYRLADVIALRVIALQGAQLVEQFFRLDPFGADLETEFAGKADGGFHQRPGLGAFLQVEDEPLVDLELAERKLVEGLQRGEAGAEIVDGELETLQPQPRKNLQREKLAALRRGFRHFQRDPFRVHLVFHAAVLEQLEPGHAAHQPRRDVDGEAQLQPLLIPGAQVAERLHGHRVGKLQNQIMGFGQRYEIVRENQANLGMLDAAQRFHAIARHAGAQRHFRLVVHDHMPGSDGLRQCLTVEAGLVFLVLEKIGQLARAEIRTRQDDRFDGLALKQAAQGCDRLGIQLSDRNHLALRAP